MGNLVTSPFHVKHPQSSTSSVSNQVLLEERFSKVKGTLLAAFPSIPLLNGLPMWAVASVLLRVYRPNENPKFNEIHPFVHTHTMKALMDAIMHSPDLSAGMLTDSAEFLASFITVRSREGGNIFNIYMETLEFYEAKSSLRSAGLYANIGCGESGIAIIDAVRRPLLLIDNDMLIARLLTSYAEQSGRSDVQVLHADVRNLSLPSASIGLLDSSYILHYLKEDEIPAVVYSFISALAPGSLMTLTEPLDLCCNHASPRKIDAIRSALRDERVWVTEIPKPVSRWDRWSGTRRGMHFEFVVITNQEA